MRGSGRTFCSRCYKSFFNGKRIRVTVVNFLFFPRSCFATNMSFGSERRRKDRSPVLHATQRSLQQPLIRAAADCVCVCVCVCLPD